MLELLLLFSMPFVLGADLATKGHLTFGPSEGDCWTFISSSMSALKEGVAGLGETGKAPGLFAVLFIVFLLKWLSSSNELNKLFT